MKILLVMDAGILVPPKGYGGHERLVAMFAKEYARLGHEVHLLVTKGSQVEGCTVHGYGKEGFPPAKATVWLSIPYVWWFLWKHRNQFDLVHNFGRLLFLIPILNHRIKKIMTYGREISGKNIQQINQIPNKNLVFTGCSANLISRCPKIGRWEVVYNAIDFNKYQLQETVAENAPLMFLGRIERIKGCHTAIAVAKATGHKLIIAGNVSPLAEEKWYFETEIQPHIDGVQIIHVGQVNDEQKNYYLGQAKALLFPIEWEEPFGMVMVEAMACGTPVIGFKRGSVPEVVENGKTGYVVNNMADMIIKIKDVNSVDRTICRQTAFAKFHLAKIGKEYLNIFN